METVGSLIDRLTTVDLKMFNTQEKLYDIRRHTYDEFKKDYMNEDGMKFLYDYFVKCSDLNLQRNNFIDEIDQTIVNMIKLALSGVDLENEGFVQRKHKTL